MTARVPCAGRSCATATGRLLLIRRGQEPGRGLWSLPGGRCEPGEDAAAAAVRETYEETGLVVTAGPLVGRVERPGPGGVTYVIDDLACTVTGGTLRAGDDADEARWVDAAELAALPVTDGLLDALTRWDVLPRLSPFTLAVSGSGQILLQRVHSDVGPAEARPGPDPRR